MTCLVQHLEDLLCIMCKRSDQVYMGHGVVRFCAHCSISWDPIEDGKSLDYQIKAVILSEDQDGELPEDMIERMGMLIGGITVVFAFERRLNNMMTIPEALFTEDQVKHLPGRHDQRTHGRGGTKDTITLADEYKAPSMDHQATELFNKWGPGDNFVMAQELGADVNLAHFQQVNSQWTQGADQDAKYDIEGILKGDPQVRALTLYDLYSSQDKEMKQSFSDWAETPQTFHRGGGRSEPFMSFTPSEAVARDASGSDQIAILTIKPSQLLGTGMTGSNEVYVASEAIKQYQFKHLPGRHPQSSHGRGGGSISGGPVSKEKRVWQGKRQEFEGQKLSKLQTGELGERVAMQALSDINGVPFETLNVGINNAPIDVIGDHQAVEVKTGLSTNGPDSQKWRATIGEPGREEKASYKALIKKMSPETKREHNRLKRQAILDRKQSMLDRLTNESSGKRIDPKVVGVIMAPDGKKADVFVVDGFHLSLPWRQAATDENYVGTYDIGE